ncbi:MAG TPA: hypothetical protein VG099_23810 [Gemmataceae bacterium]|nr:hypothetical protein [Gemmataceae bacterium]
MDKPKIGTVQSGQEAESPVQGLPAGQAEGQKTDAEVTKRRRPCYDRDHTWLAWYEDEETETYHRPAKIRDKWNCLSVEQRKAISPGAFNRIAEKRRGVDLVKKAIENALHERGSAK